MYLCTTHKPCGINYTITEKDMFWLYYDSVYYGVNLMFKLHAIMTNFERLIDIAKKDHRALQIIVCIIQTIWSSDDLS